MTTAEERPQNVISGFRPEDFDTSCVNGGNCPAQEPLPTQFLGDVITRRNVESGVVDIADAYDDRAKLELALAGFKVTARQHGCGGECDGKCGALVAISPESVKRPIIQGFKNLFFGKGE